MFEFGFVIGFIVALAITGAIGWLVGAARIARVAGALTGTGHTRRRKQPAPPSAPLEADVRAALIQMGAPSETARRAAAAAWQANPTGEFEPVFRAALRGLNLKTQAVPRLEAAPAGRTM